MDKAAVGHDYVGKVKVVVVCHVTIVAIGHGLLKKFWPFGNRLRSTHCREFPYLKLCRPADFVRTTQLSYFHNAIRLNFDLSFSIIPLF